MRLMTLVLVGVVTLGSTGLAMAQAPPDPLGVDEAVRIALRQNRAFLQTEAGVTIAAGGRRSALSALLPDATGSVTWGKDSSTSTNFDFPFYTRTTAYADDRPDDVEVLGIADIDRSSTFEGTTWSYGASYDLSLQEIYGYRSANADVKRAKYAVEDAAQDLAFQVRQQFYLVLRAQDLLTVQQEDLRLAKDEERRTTSMFEVGSVARADVMRTKVRVADAELALIQQENAVELEETRLAVLLGYAADTDLTLSGDLSPDIQTVVDSVAAVDQARTRPDLMAAKLSVDAARNNKRAADLYWLPRLFASYRYNDTSGDSESDVLFPITTTIQEENPRITESVYGVFPDASEVGRDGWSVDVGASINLDALLFWSGNQKTAAGVARQREYQLEDLELEAQRELEEAILNLRASVRAIAAAEAGVASAQEDLRLSRERYEQGLGTILELLESQVALTRARNQQVNALTGLRISEAAYQQARGAEIPR